MVHWYTEVFDSLAGKHSTKLKPKKNKVRRGTSWKGGTSKHAMSNVRIHKIIIKIIILIIILIYIYIGFYFFFKIFLYIYIIAIILLYHYYLL